MQRRDVGAETHGIFSFVSFNHTTSLNRRRVRVYQRNLCVPYVRVFSRVSRTRNAVRTPTRFRGNSAAKLGARLPLGCTTCVTYEREIIRENIYRNSI